MGFRFVSDFLVLSYGFDETYRRKMADQPIWSRVPYLYEKSKPGVSLVS